MRCSSLAALFGLAGDIALLDDSDDAFIAGLASFAVGHLAYVGAALTVGVGWAALWAVPFLVVLLGWRFVPETVPGARRVGRHGAGRRRSSSTPS